MKVFKLTFLLVLLSSVAFAQGVFKFNEETHDFGNNIQEGDPAVFEFVFKNEGNAPIIIQNVQASCGCTTPEWTKEPVLPGQSGKIKASYASQGRPGFFTKTITVTSNANEASKVLTIKGTVVSDPAKQSKIELIKNVVKLGKVQDGQDITQKIAFKNTGVNPLMVYSLKSACNCVQMINATQNITSGAEGNLEFRFTPKGEGIKKEVVTIQTNSTVTPTITFTIEAEVVKSLENKSPVKETNGNMFNGGK